MSQSVEENWCVVLLRFPYRVKISGLLAEFGMSKIQDSLVGEPGTHLSGGERRRLNLCMQLLSHKAASIFLLDEPVTGLVLFLRSLN